MTTEDANAIFGLDGVVDLTTPPFQLTITRADDGSWDQDVSTNGVPVAIAVLGLLTAAEDGMIHLCADMAPYAHTIKLIREAIASHHAHTNHGDTLAREGEGS